MSGLNVTMGMRGEYKFEIHREGKLIQETQWVPNLVLNGGLDQFGTDVGGYSIYGFLLVGTGSSTPVATQTGLDSVLAGTGGLYTRTFLGTGAPDYKGQFTYTFPFAQGAVVGNISEAGIGNYPNGNNNLFSRALILDDSGQPVTLSVLPIDQLTVYYRLTVAANYAQTTGSFSLSGTTYTYTCACNNPGGFTDNSAQWNSGSCTPSIRVVQPYGVDGNAAGSRGNPPTLTYVSGSNSLTSRITISSADTQVPISFINIAFYTGLSYRFTFDTPIPKSSTNELTLNVTYSWGR